MADKDRANFCDYFRPRAAAPARAVSRTDDARARLDALFKKKS